MRQSRRDRTTSAAREPYLRVLMTCARENPDALPYHCRSNGDESAPRRRSRGALLPKLTGGSRATLLRPSAALPWPRLALPLNADLTSQLSASAVSQQSDWSDRHLEFFCGAKSDFLARLDLNLLARRRVAPDPGSAIPHLQNSESGNLHALTILQVLGDEPDKIFEHLLAMLLRKLVLFSQSIGQVLSGD
jgi:hypothetical protein